MYIISLVPKISLANLVYDIQPILEYSKLCSLFQHAGSHSPEWEAAVLKACEMMVEVMEGNVVGEEAPGIYLCFSRLYIIMLSAWEVLDAFMYSDFTPTAPGCRIEVTAQELLTVGGIYWENVYASCELQSCWAKYSC